MSTPAGRPMVLGLGEPARRDDGCGPRVVRALRGRLSPSVALVERVAEPLQLLELWSDAAPAIVVDAGRTGAAAGSVLRLEGAALARAPIGPSTSSHALSLPDAYALAVELGRAPRRLVVYLIEAGELGFGPTLSEEVAAGVPRAAEAIVRELQAWPTETG